MERANSFVLDSYAVIGYLENETFSGRIQEFLTNAKKGEPRLYFHAIHLGEVFYITLREQGQTLANLAFSRIKALPLKIIDYIDDKLLLQAATLKANYPISYADCFAAAMAIIHKCPLLTGDPEFKSLDMDNLIKVEWLT